MPEMADSGKDHGEAEFVGGGDYLFVVDGAAGLDDGGCAGGGYGFKAIGEGEKGSTAFMAPKRAASTRLICPAPMPMVWPSLA